MNSSGAAFTDRKLETDANVIFSSVLCQRALISLLALSRGRRGKDITGCIRLTFQYLKPTMTCRNVFIFLLMILALPISGTAQTMTLDTRHTMSLSAIASNDDTSALDASAHECCDPDALKSACENGQECKTSSLLQLAVNKTVSLALPPRHPTLLPVRVPARTPDIIWHPPRS